MRYAAAYVLATLAGNANPDVATIAKIIGSVGIDCDKDKAQKVIDACKGKSVDQIIEEGTKKLSSLPAGGAAVAAAPAAAAAAPAGDAKKGAAKEEPKKEDKKKDDSEEEEGDMVCRRILSFVSTILRILGIWLIRLNPTRNKQITHWHHSYLLQCLFSYVCFVLIYYEKKENNQPLRSSIIRTCSYSEQNLAFIIFRDVYYYSHFRH